MLGHAHERTPGRSGEPFGTTISKPLPAFRAAAIRCYAGLIELRAIDHYKVVVMVCVVDDRADLLDLTMELLFGQLNASGSWICWQPFLWCIGCMPKRPHRFLLQGCDSAIWGLRGVMWRPTVACSPSRIHQRPRPGCFM